MVVKFLNVWYKREWYSHDSLIEKFIGFSGEFGFFVTRETDIISNNMIISMGKHWKDDFDIQYKCDSHPFIVWNTS